MPEEVVSSVRMLLERKEVLLLCSVMLVVGALLFIKVYLESKE